MSLNQFPLMTLDQLPLEDRFHVICSIPSLKEEFNNHIMDLEKYNLWNSLIEPLKGGLYECSIGFYKPIELRADPDIFMKIFKKWVKTGDKSYLSSRTLKLFELANNDKTIEPEAFSKLLWPISEDIRAFFREIENGPLYDLEMDKYTNNLGEYLEDFGGDHDYYYDASKCLVLEFKSKYSLGEVNDIVRYLSQFDWLTIQAYTADLLESKNRRYIN